MSLEEAKRGRTFSDAAFFDKLEEVVAVLLMAFVPILTATHTRVGKEVQKTKRKAPPPQAKKPSEKDSDDSDEDDDDNDDAAGWSPDCFQLLGVDVLLDESMQPW